MKARLVQYRELTQLLLCTGRIIDCTFADACEFLLNFDNNKYYKGNGTWDYDVAMEKYNGDTIATVSDDGILHIENAELYRNMFANKEIHFLTAAEFAELHSKGTAIVRRMCTQGRIPGAILKGSRWLIPEGTPYPADERVRK